MEILELNLKHFGMFTDYRLEMHPGVNVISGSNETGKSTLHAFIRAMLYGLSRNRSRALDEYQLRQPWENPAYFAGSMKLLYGGKIYRIDRNFYKKDQEVSVVCETDGTKADDPEKAIAAFTSNLSADDFDNTLFIRQAGGSITSSLGEHIRDYLVNVEQTGGTDVDVSASSAYLKKKRKEIESEKKARLSEIEEQISGIANEEEYLRKDLERLTAVITAGTPSGANDTAAEKTDAVQKKTYFLDDHTDKGANEENPESGSESSPQDHAEHDDAENDDRIRGGALQPVLIMLSFAAAALSAACAFAAQERMVRYLLAAAAIILSAAGVWVLYRMLHPRTRRQLEEKRAKREAFLDRHLGFRDDPDDPYDMRDSRVSGVQAPDANRMRELDNQRAAGRSEVLAQEIAANRQKTELCHERLEKLYEKKASLGGYDREIEAVDMAYSRINELSGKIYRESGGRFQEEVSVILSGLTEGRYRSISLDERMQLHVNTDDRLLELGQVSFGTAQQIYLAMRLAAANLLTGDAAVPVILDEPFAMYDDERLESALRCLMGSGRQVILFTCQRRELDILAKIRKQ